MKKRINRHIKDGLIYVHRKKIRIKVISNKRGFFGDIKFVISYGVVWIYVMIE